VVTTRPTEAEPLFDDRPDALTIGELYRRVQRAIASVFPPGQLVWVRGEIQSIGDRTGHCYMDLVDPDGSRSRDTPVLKIKCWRSTWGPMKAMLAEQGIVLEPGTVVTVRGRVDLYQPRGEIGFVISEVDVHALLGRLAARRAALVRALEREGLLQRNKARVVPPLPLRIGLVASPGSEGYRDFLGQLAASPFAFHLLHVPSVVQGSAAPTALSAAVTTLSAEGCDVMVVVRGGGSKADLAAFDAEPVARAIATATVPVWTGIGHTGDLSVADLVANRSFVTPTECGQELVRTVAVQWDRIVSAADSLSHRATAVVEDSLSYHRQARARLAASARHQIGRHAVDLANRAERIALRAPRVVESASSGLAGRAGRLGPLAIAQLDRAGDRVVAWRRLLAAYDVHRQLERGYSLTLDARGRIVRSVAHLAPGDVLVTRLVDGTVRSAVADVVPTTVTGPPGAVDPSTTGDLPVTRTIVQPAMPQEDP